MRIAPRTLICANGYRIHAPIAGARFEELQELCTTAGDKSSLAIAMAGVIVDLMTRGHTHKSVELSSELTALLESIGEPTLIVGLAISPMSMGLITARWQRCCGCRRWSSICPMATRPRQITSVGARTGIRLWITCRSLGGRTARRGGRSISIGHRDGPKLRSLVTCDRPHLCTEWLRTQRCCGRRRGDTGHRSGSGCSEHSADDLALGFSLIAMGVALLGGAPLRPRPSED